MKKLLLLTEKRFSQLSRVVKEYEDTICLFYTSSVDFGVDVNEKIESIISSAYEQTDGLIKLIKIELDATYASIEQQKKYKIKYTDSPVIMYFKKGQKYAASYGSFNKRTLDKWISEYFYKETKTAGPEIVFNDN